MVYLKKEHGNDADDDDGDDNANDDDDDDGYSDGDGDGDGDDDDDDDDDYDNENLLKFDQLHLTAMSEICNVSFSDDQSLQTSLPAKSDGLEIRRMFSRAPPTLLALTVDSRDLQNQILYTRNWFCCQTLW